MSKHSALNRFGRSGNPAFSQGFGINENISGEVMTLDGTVNKTGILLALCVGGAYFGWNSPGLVMPAILIGFVIALFNPPNSTVPTTLRPCSIGVIPKPLFEKITGLLNR